MAFPFQNPMMGGQQPDPMMPPRVPWAQNPAITMAGIGLLSGRNLNEGFANLAQTVPAGMAAKAGMQQFMLAQQERQKKQAEEDARRNQINEALKNWPNMTPEQRALAMAMPEAAAGQLLGSMTPSPGTDDMREYNKAVEQGFTGSFMDYQVALRQAGAQRSVGAPPPGYKVEYDPAGNPISMVPVPGGPADTSKADTARREQRQAVGDIVLQDIGRALDTIEKSPGWTTGLGGSVMSNIPGSSAKNLNSLLTTIKANIGFDRLQQMREASPTGGALGQVAVQELQSLQSVLGSVEQAQDPEQLSFNLKRLYNTYLDVIHGPGQGPARVPLTEEAASSGPDAGPAPEGVDPEDWKYMTPEQRALFE